MNNGLYYLTLLEYYCKHIAYLLYYYDGYLIEIINSKKNPFLVVKRVKNDSTTYIIRILLLLLAAVHAIIIIL